MSQFRTQSKREAMTSKRKRMTNDLRNEAIYRSFRDFSIANDLKIEQISRRETGRESIRACVLRYLEEMRQWQHPDIDDIIFQGRRLGRLGLDKAITDIESWSRKNAESPLAVAVANALIESFNDYNKANPNRDEILRGGKEKDVLEEHNIPVTTETLKNTF